MSPLLLAIVMTKLPLVVRTYNVAGIDPRVLERARCSVEQTLNAVGIEPVWRPCHSGVCADPPRRGEVIVRLANATALSQQDSLGYSLVDPAEQAGTLATIFEDRVRTLAAGAQVDEGQLLGRVIAHEIGHLLLGTSTHGESGLMRANWFAEELQRARAADWVFSTGEAFNMRYRLAVRGGTATAR
jgi:hypothetical protein